jgi:MFS family permease
MTLGGIRKSATVALSILATVSFFNYFDRVLLSVLAQPISAEFNLSDTQLGLLSGPAFVVIYTVTSVVGGLIADRGDRRKLISATLALWSFMTACCGMAQSFAQLLLFRLGVGLGEGSVNPAAISLLSDHYPRERRAFPFSIFHGVGVIGIAASFLVGGYVATHFGWRAAFLIAGAPGIIVAVIALVLMQEPQRGRFDSGPVASFTLRQTFTMLMRNRMFLYLSLSASFGTYAGLGIHQWLPVFFIRNHGLSLTEIGLLFGPAISLGIMIGQIAGGRLANMLARGSLDRPLLWCLISNLLVPPIYCMALWSSSTSVALIASFAAAAVGTSWAPAFLAGLQNCCEPRLRATAMGLSNVSQSLIAQAIVPFLVGFVSDLLRPVLGPDSLRLAITLGLLSNLAAAFVFTLARREMRQSEAKLTSMSGAFRM